MNSFNDNTAMLCALGGAALLGLTFFEKKKEGFWGNPQRAYKVDREVGTTSGMFSIPGQYQTSLSPRFSNVNYGPNLSTQMQNQHQFLPKGGIQGCSSPIEGYSSGFVDGDFNKVARHLGGLMNDNSSLVKVQGSGAPDQPIIYDRLMMANKQSRLRSQGDQIRGDLPISPIQRGMFDVKVNPNLDLQGGALNVIAGTQNEAGRALSAMIRQSSGYGQTTIGGVDLQMTPGVPSRELGLSSAHGDIQVRGFP
jgi:hypothetical protein